MSRQRLSATAAAITALVCQHALAARPIDNGNPALYNKQVYVDNMAASCTTSTCGTQSKPYSDLVAALKVVTPGTELIIAGGSPYYGTVNGALPSDISRGVIQFEQLKVGDTQAATLVRKWAGTANPVIRGSLKVTGWKRVDSIFNSYPSFTYSRSWTLTNKQAFGSTSTQVVEPQQIFNGDTSLLQIGGTPMNYRYPSPAGTEYAQQEQFLGGTLWRGYIAPDSVTPGYKLKANEFYFDASNKMLYVRLAAAMPSAGLEVSAYQHIAYGAEFPRNVYNLTIQDIDFERSNTSGYGRGGAVSLLGKNITLDRINVRRTDLACLGITAVNFTVKNSTFEYCGQTGIGASGKNGLITDNIVRKTNQRHFNRDWEAGGMKLIGGGQYLFDAQRAVEPNPLPFINGLDNSTISRNRVYDNNGPDRTVVGRPAVPNNEAHGIWLDTDNTDNVITDNVLAYNGIGLFLEINARNKVTRNQIFGNVAQGIQLKDSDTTLSDNWIIGNIGFGLITPNDTRQINAGDTGFQPYRNTVTNNRFAWNGAISTSNPLELSLVVDPSNPVGNKLTVSGNRYCSNYQYYQLKKVSGGELVSATNGVTVDTLDAWNTWLASYGTGRDTSAVLMTVPSDLKASLIGKSETLVTNAYNGQMLSTSYANACNLPAR